MASAALADGESSKHDGESSKNAQAPSSSTTAALGAKHWCKPNKIVEATPQQLLTGLDDALLPPAWRLLVQGNGAPTRLLALLTGSATKVTVIDMSSIGSSTDDAPSSIKELPAPRLRRQVWLGNDAGEVLGYAVSWWTQSVVEEHLKDTSKPIWTSLTSKRHGVFREILGVYLAHCPDLESKFGAAGPFWCRHYMFWRGGAPLTMILEVFSPRLQAYLGPLPKHNKAAAAPASSS